jgi:hypothetical protein
MPKVCHVTPGTDATQVGLSCHGRKGIVQRDLTRAKKYNLKYPDMEEPLAGLFKIR